MHCRIRITGFVHGKRHNEVLFFVQFCNSILIVFNEWVFANLKKNLTVLQVVCSSDFISERLLYWCIIRESSKSSVVGLRYICCIDIEKSRTEYWFSVISKRDLVVFISTSFIAAIVSSCTDTPKLFPSSIFALASSANCARLGLTISITSTIFLLDGMSVCPEIVSELKLKIHNIQYNYFLIISQFMSFEAILNSGILSNSFKCIIRSGNF
ncbi:hypothetical protein AGLY_018015 [Aphis glycines]|uniref:Uncharacterized protein n=1 Tax=Aphis glycines TaxID=307491 RepID=A0A6G0SU10_APHGL|nr:hypothetical protein AGLY_018015 [Aphis glycines]